MRKYILGGLSILLVVVIWTVYAYSVNNNYVFPNPITVFKSLVQLLGNFKTYSIIAMTLLRLLISFIVSAMLGVILGLLAGNYMPLEEFLHPIVVSLRTLPIASVIIIMIILLGRQFSLYIITFLMIFPIVYEASKHGVRNIPKSLKNHIALEGHPKWVILFNIQLPLSMPYIRTALFQSIGLGFKVIVMAEFISQTRIGIGRELYNGSISIHYEIVFAWTIIIIFIVTLFELLLKSLRKAYDI
ncbi:MAG: ABC transporter permease subunit [Tenericutes bacterium]|jgi:NitT/TauT family transport system permease protein|nr:ABC transporter permease subunit [Mycoplasmatota bacterium]